MMARAESDDKCVWALCIMELKLYMSLRTPRERNEGPLSSKKPSVKRLDAVLATGFLRTGALVPKLTFHPPSADATTVLERTLSLHAQQTIMTVGRELVNDLESFFSVGYTRVDSKLQLAHSVYIPMFGEITATARIAKMSNDVYAIRINAFVYSGPYGVASQEFDTVVDMRRMRDRFKTIMETSETTSEFIEALKQETKENNELREVFEAYAGVSVIDLDSATYMQQQGATTLYQHISESIRSNTESTWTVVIKCMIELEKAYLTSLLMMAYQPGQVLAIMNAYDAKHIFGFVSL